MKIYFALGSGGEIGARVLKKVGACRALFSFADVASKEEAPLFVPEMMLDSGAYSVETRSLSISLRAYILWLQLYLDKYPMVVTYVNFDNLSDPKKTMENQQSMESEGLSPLPVYHYSEPESLLDYYCNKYKYVGLGGLAVGTISPEKLKTFWERIAEHYPDNRFHVFGVGTMTPFYKYQPYSMDSMTWLHNAFRGKLAGYRDGLPATADWSRKAGWEFFTDREELMAINARAIMDYEKLEWLKNVDGKHKVDEENPQRRLF